MSEFGRCFGLNLFEIFSRKNTIFRKISTSGRNIVDVGWATMKSGCLPITATVHCTDRLVLLGAVPSFVPAQPAARQSFSYKWGAAGWGD